MNCSKINALMMKHIDKELSEKEAVLFNEHLAVCENCRKDLAVYEQMLIGFSEIESEAFPQINAPEDFELAVMAKIELLTEENGVNDSRYDNLLCWLCGSFSVLLGMFVILFINKEYLLAFADATPQFSTVVKVLVTASEYVSSFSLQVLQLINTAMASLSIYAASARFAFIAIFSVLAVVQVFVYRKGKVEA